MKNNEKNITIRPGIYRHYKNKKYKVLFTATHTETKEELVIYQAMYGENLMWARPVSMFVETIEIDGRKIPRYELIGWSLFIF